MICLVIILKLISIIINGLFTVFNMFISFNINFSKFPSLKIDQQIDMFSFDFSAVSSTSALRSCLNVTDTWLLTALYSELLVSCTKTLTIFCWMHQIMCGQLQCSSHGPPALTCIVRHKIMAKTYLRSSVRSGPCVPSPLKFGSKNRYQSFETVPRF